MLFKTQSINIEDIPSEFRDRLQLPHNGGNIISVDEDSSFGDFLKLNGFEFRNGWGWLVIFR